MKKVLMLLFLLISVAAYSDTKKYAVGDKFHFVFDFNKSEDFKIKKEYVFDNIKSLNYAFENEKPLNYFNHSTIISILPYESGFIANLSCKDVSTNTLINKTIFLTKGLVFYTYEDTKYYIKPYKCTITEIYPNYFIAERSEIED